LSTVQAETTSCSLIKLATRDQARGKKSNARQGKEKGSKQNHAGRKKMSTLRLGGRKRDGDEKMNNPSSPARDLSGNTRQHQTKIKKVGKALSLRRLSVAGLVLQIKEGQRKKTGIEPNLQHRLGETLWKDPYRLRGHRA